MPKHIKVDLKRKRSETILITAKGIVISTRICKPKLSPEAKELLAQKFVELKKEKKKPVISLRVLESLRRIAQALAKMELSEVVRTEHAREAIRLMDKSIWGKSNTFRNKFVS